MNLEIVHVTYELGQKVKIVSKRKLEELTFSGILKKEEFGYVHIKTKVVFPERLLPYCGKESIIIKTGTTFINSRPRSYTFIKGFAPHYFYSWMFKTI
jgi:hypothetical protein